MASPRWEGFTHPRQHAGRRVLSLNNMEQGSTNQCPRPTSIPPPGFVHKALLKQLRGLYANPALGTIIPPSHKEFWRWTPSAPCPSSHRPIGSRSACPCPAAPHQLVPFFRQQGISVLQLPNDRTQLCNFKLEAPSILFIQLLFLKQKSTANNCS